MELERIKSIRTYPNTGNQPTAGLNFSEFVLIPRLAVSASKCNNLHSSLPTKERSLGLAAEMHTNRPHRKAHNEAPSSNDGLQGAQHAEEGCRGEGLQRLLALLIDGAQMRGGPASFAGSGAVPLSSSLLVAGGGQHGLQAAAVLVLLLLHDALVVGARALDHSHGQAANATERHLRQTSPTSTLQVFWAVIL